MAGTTFKAQRIVAESILTESAELIETIVSNPEVRRYGEEFWKDIGRLLTNSQEGKSEEIINYIKSSQEKISKNVDLEKSYKKISNDLKNNKLNQKDMDKILKNLNLKTQKEYLKDLKKVTTKVKVPIKSKSFHFKDAAKPSDFLHRRMTLGGMRSIPASTKALAVLKKVGKRTGIGKAVAAATVVAGAYEAGKRKLFSLDKPSKEKILKEVKKKKVDKKSIGGETVVMKSGGGYIDNLL